MIFDQKFLNFDQNLRGQIFLFLLDFFFIFKKKSSENVFPLIDAEIYKLSIAGIFSSFLDLGAEL